VFFGLFALFIDLLTDKVQPLSRSLGVDDATELIRQYEKGSVSLHGDMVRTTWHCVVEGDTFIVNTFIVNTFIVNTFIVNTFIVDTFIVDTFIVNTFIVDTFIVNTFIVNTFIVNTFIVATFSVCHYHC
jgi:hypothetical protein